MFRVEYFNGAFRESKKVSITPCVDFDLGDEPGYGSPDASAGVGKDDFSVRWTGRLVAPASGAYTFSGDCDGLLRLWFDETLVLDKSDHGRRTVQGKTELAAGRSYRVQIDMSTETASRAITSPGAGRLDRRILTLTRGVPEDARNAGPKPTGDRRAVWPQRRRLGRSVRDPRNIKAAYRTLSPAGLSNRFIFLDRDRPFRRAAHPGDQPPEDQRR